jgi:prepilin-type N-terminal cleavage/methylation domain-containing protein
MKTFRLKLFAPDCHTASGFTLIELLASIAIMGMTASFISFALSSIVSSNQNLGKEQNRRVEASRAVRIQVEERGMREGIANSQEWAEIASRKKAIAERA